MAVDFFYFGDIFEKVQKFPVFLRRYRTLDVRVTVQYYDAQQKAEKERTEKMVVKIETKKNPRRKSEGANKKHQQIAPTCVWL
jgi:hypothetical protein